MAFENLIKEAGGELLRWQTTNMEYGNFYRYIKGEKHKDADCRIEGNKLKQEWLQSKNQIEHLRLYPLGDTLLSSDNHEGSSTSCLGAQVEDTNNQSNGSIGTFLKESISTTQPQLNADYFVKTRKGVEQEYGPDPSVMASIGEPTLQWKPKPLRPKILFESLQKTKDLEDPMERLARLKRKTGSWSHRERSFPCKRQQTDGNFGWMHSATKRYSYYKYYGFGGQGAKTSWGHNFPLGQEPPYATRAPSTMD